MKLPITAGVLMLAAMSSSDAVVVLASNFDGNTGAAASTGGNPSGSGIGAGQGSSSVTISYTGLEAANANTAVAAISPTGGFLYLTSGSGATRVNQDSLTIGNNLNSGNKSDLRGYVISFTPTASYDLESIDVVAGHVNGSGGRQGFLSSLTIRVFDGITPIASPASQTVNDIDDPGEVNGFPAPNPPLTYNFDLTGAALVAGKTYTIQVTENNLIDGGAFPHFDGFTLNAVPEPGSATLLGLAACGVFFRRRR